MTGISALTVVYEKAFARSATLRSLCALPPELRRRIELHVRDNSPAAPLGVEPLREAGFGSVELWHDGENRPLGEVYRRYVDRASGPVLFFFDDDTEVDAAYVLEAEAVLVGSGADEGPALVCVPQVRDRSGRLYSPSRFGVFSGRHDPTLAPGRHEGLNAVMSGLAATRRHLQALGPGAFSIRSPLYGVDTMFMLAHARAGGATQVCAAELRHDLSRDTGRSVPAALHRSWLEARGVAWTVLTYRPRWAPLLPAYLGYFMARRAAEALLRRARR